MSNLHYDSADDREVAATPLPTTQHPVVKIPFSLVIDGRTYAGRGLSLVDAEATGLVTPQMLHEKRLVTLQFAFVGFNVSFNVDAQVTAVSVETGTVAIRFLEPTGPHLPQLRYLMNAYIGG